MARQGAQGPPQGPVDLEDEMIDWDDRGGGDIAGDRFSFEDSDRFEEDSMCSWSTEPESVCNNWRGWKKPSSNAGIFTNGKRGSEEAFAVPSLTELTAKCVASHIPFELVEHVYPPVPEQLQLRIAFWSFPDNEEDIRLYSCLANGSADEFSRGENLHRNHMVKDPLQIGFHLSASVQQARYNNSSTPTHNVAVTFDRRRISSCNCTCQSQAYWCSHVVAVCLTRIHWPHLVTLRAPVSESLSRLHREQLQKFAQYLISELPQQILPTAQRLLDELLGSQPSAINSVCGAPDPTAGASAADQTSWYLDEKTLHDNIKKILIKFCVPAPMVFSDVNYLSTVAPPAAAEWSSLLRPLRGREPEGMWNLLSIVREMFKRNDRNAVPLLEIITEECMACEQILIWWFNTKVALLSGNSGHGGSGGGKHNNINSNTHASQHAGSSLCDEVVILWRLAALNPGLAPSERDMLHSQFTTWHMKILEKVSKCRNTNSSSTSNYYKNASSLKADLDIFTGFKPAIEACYLDWDDYPMPGITYTSDINPMYHCPFTCFRHGPDSARGESQVTQVNSSKAVLNGDQITHTGHSHHHLHHRHHHHLFRNHRFEYVNVMSLNPVEYSPHHPHITQLNERDGNRSSVSSEGFCEVDDDINILQVPSYNDSDSQEGGGSDSSSSSSSRDTNTPPTRQITNPQASNIDQKQPGSKTPVNEPNSDPNWSGNEPPPSTDTEEESRRQSKDESSSSLDSPNSGDEYSVYFYNSKEANGGEPVAGSSGQCPASGGMPVDQVDGKTDVFSEIRRCNDPWDVLFARAEGLHAHGHSKEACILGVKLAEELLANPPNLMIEVPQIPKKKGKKPQLNPATHQLSVLASGTLAKGAFLCSVLSENPEHFHLAFRVGMFGLEMARPPASTKPLEVKLANQEADLVNLLKRLPLGHKELQILRERAEQIKDGTLKSRGEAMLPIMLASFIFDALVIPSIVGRDRSKIISLRLPTDEPLAFEAAVVALGLKANVSEADHPLLCEGTRRQRGELAITLLTFYKDYCYKICRIMEKLLDREIHQLLKTPLLSSYYTNNPPIRSQYNHLRREECDSTIASINPFVPPSEMIPTDANCCSRPHSSTSAEVEQGMTNLSLAGPSGQISQGAISRTKEGRYKKRAYPSIPNQPSEAGAHFMFELAKTVLTKAGGTSSTSLFTQPSTSQSHHGPHRALHMCAFQLGLYALGLHNCVSPNWLSRTYSSHVSWITGQAMEIGAAAISFLIDTWEGHLTPPEAASIADRASRGCDINMVSAAANLALSVLPHSHALNPNEIQRAILQCKEQSDDMLEHACLTVESAAKGGGVYPEVLFQVAKYWYELYIRHTPGGEQLIDNDIPPHEALMDPHAQLVALIEQPVTQEGSPAAAPVVVTTAPPPYPHATPPVGMYVSHYNFVPAHPTGAPIGYAGPLQPIPTATQHVHVQYQFPYPPPPPPGAQALPPFPPPNVGQATYAGLPPPPTPPQVVPVLFSVDSRQTHDLEDSRFQVPFSTTPTTSQYVSPPTSQYAAPPPQYVAPTITATHQQPPPVVYSSPPPAGASGPATSAHQPQLQYFGSAPVALAQAPPPSSRPVAQQQQHIYAQQPVPAPPQGIAAPAATQQAMVRQHRPHQLNQVQLRYLLTAYRVGMLALDTLARRVHDDRPQAKYARNPPYGEDVKWLLRISKHLGSHYLHHFCVCAVNSIVSPFVLHDVAIEAAQYLARNNPGLVMQHLRTALMPLVTKCQQMYIQCMHQKLYHLTSADYEDFVSIVCAARAAFQITPEGTTQFKEWLSSIRRSKSCKKDLWTQINTALQANSK
ncbi:zinc finger SWIM domain-containing protein 8 isoform X2 [Sitophilus oryzae]|uniref:Zinc finger SWIM domain-containing protein 8 isoform X2 n=1 Tax=Sitophilus oryzae TaxID=7048 RepID=A0A6J2X5L0_SITOR|nr:zinc finger SWIM domain-containing protein 8 isoform X2 [Sitophilus oryzae]